MGIDSRKVSFQGAQGVDLAARLELPSGPVRATAIFAHCFTCGKDSSAAARISAALAELGYAVLRFDFTGLGGSGGDFENTSFQSNIDDLIAAARYLEETQDAPRLLVGHSLGGAAVLHAAAEIPSVTAVATLGAPFDPEHVTHLLGDAIATIETEGVAEVMLAGRPFKVGKTFLEALKNRDPAKLIGELDAALMVMHAPLDDFVGIENARLIYEAAKHPKSFVSLDDANHLLTNRVDAQYAASVLGAWAQRYVPDLPTTARAPKPAGGEVVVSETGAGKYANEIRSDRHVLYADEPVDVGGLNSGLAPYELLMASLGACTSMTLRMYAERKELPLERVTVRLKHEKIHASDCATCETQTGKIDRIERVIALDGDLTDEQRQRLLEIADKCPVHRTLHGEVLVETELKG